MEIQKHTTTDIISISKAFAESGMFPDIRSAAMALVKIQAGQELGIKPFAAMSGIHIIQGKATIGAGLIASSVKGSGKYDYRVITQTDKVCEIEFFQGKESLGKSKFTIEEAKKAGTKNIDKFPANMLFARAISNGVKWYTPDVFQGPVYVPEEMQQEPEQTPQFEVIATVEPTVSNNEALHLSTIEAITDTDTLTAYWKALPKHERTPAITKAVTELGNKLKQQANANANSNS
jgi:hypothetical protein